MKFVDDDDDIAESHQTEAAIFATRQRLARLDITRGVNVLLVALCSSKMHSGSLVSPLMLCCRLTSM